MALNPLGLVIMSDGGVPRTFTARAREVISGGEFVFVSGADNVVNSGLASFADGDILVATDPSGTTVNGIALHNAGSNSLVTVATRGRYIVAVEEDLVAGRMLDLGAATAHAVRLSDLYTNVVGRAMANATSGGFTILDLQV